MNKQQYLLRLKDLLEKLPESEQERAVTYYQEIIEDRMEEGMTEEEAVLTLEEPNKIAMQILMERETEKQLAVRKQKKRSASKLILLIITSPLWLTLLLVYFCLLLSAYIILGALIFTMWCLAGGLGIGTLAGIIMIPFAFYKSIPVGFYIAGCSILCLGLFLFTYLGSKAGTQYLLTAIKWVTEISLKLLKWGGEINETD